MKQTDATRTVSDSSTSKPVLSEAILRNIWRQTQERPRIWTNEEMTAVMQHLLFYRNHMNKTMNIPDIPGATIGGDWHLP